MNPTAHNLSVQVLILALSNINCEYVDAFIEDEHTLVFRKSPFQADEDEGETDIKETII